MDSKYDRYSCNILLIQTEILEAAWSQWSECLGSCVTSRRRVCSEQYGCNGLEYEERECPDTSNSCFQPLSDMIDDGLNLHRIFNLI